MKILIADDHTLFRESLCLVLSRICDNTLILQASDSTAALELAMQHKDIALILMDIDMPGMNGLKAVAVLQKRMPDVPIVIISAHEDHASIREALDVGAKGFVPKNTPTDVMLSALNLVLSGGIYLPTQLLSELPSSYNHTLTPRQLEILRLLQQGLQNKNIAHQLELSESTVKVHVRRIFTALGVKNRSQAVNCALEMGIL